MSGDELAELQVIVDRAQIMPGVTVWKAEPYAGREFDLEIECKNPPPIITRVDVPVNLWIRDDTAAFMERIRATMPTIRRHDGSVHIPIIGTGA